jgi:hypothetical protein
MWFAGQRVGTIVVRPYCSKQKIDGMEIIAVERVEQAVEAMRT